MCCLLLSWYIPLTRVKCTKPLCVCELQLFYVGQVIRSHHQIHKKKVPYISTWGNPQDKRRNIPIVHKVGADYWKCNVGALLLQLWWKPLQLRDKHAWFAVKLPKWILTEIIVNIFISCNGYPSLNLTLLFSHISTIISANIHLIIQQIKCWGNFKDFHGLSQRCCVRTHAGVYVCTWVCVHARVYVCVCVQYVIFLVSHWVLVIGQGPG